MTIKVPAVGEVIVLSTFLNKAAGQDQQLKLYQNNYTPANTDTAASYTECSFGGYAGVPLTNANWTVAGGNPSQASYNAAQQFTYSGGATQTEYGYFVIQQGSGTLMYAERDPSPFTFVIPGDAVRITPSISCDST